MKERGRRETEEAGLKLLFSDASSTFLCWRQYRKKVGIGSLPSHSPHLALLSAQRGALYVIVCNYWSKFVFCSELWVNTNDKFPILPTIPNQENCHPFYSAFIHFYLFSPSLLILSIYANFHPYRAPISPDTPVSFLSSDPFDPAM